MGVLSALVGLDVEQVWVWWSLRLVFQLGTRAEPDIYVDVTEFEFVDPDGRRHLVNVEANPAAAGPVLGLLRQRVIEASALAYELRIAFANGAQVVCSPDSQFEAWTARLPEGTIYCPPGGDPAYPG